MINKCTISIKKYFLVFIYVLGLLLTSCFGFAQTQPTDYFRSIQSGNWNDVSTWQSSSNNLTWISATTIPTANASLVSIQTGHVVSITSPQSISSLVVLPQATLHVQDTIWVTDKIGDDIVVMPNATVSYKTKQTIFLNAATIRVKQGGTLSLQTSGLTDSNSYIHQSSHIYEHLSILEWYFSNDVPELNGITFFPFVAADTTPIFRVSVASTKTIGGNLNTTINGIFEVNTNLKLAGSGIKTFRNGISGTATLDQQNAASIHITGKAILAGSGNLNLNNNGLIISGLCSMQANKNCNGGNVIVTGVFDANSFQLTGSYSFTLTGLIKVGHANGFSQAIATNNNINIVNGTVDFTSLGTQFIEARDYGQITNSGNGSRTLSGNGVISLTGSFSPGSGVYNITGSTIKFNGNQSMPSFTTNFSGIQFYHVIIQNGNSYLNQDVKIIGNLTINGGTLFLADSVGTNAYKLSVAGNLTMNGGTLDFLPATNNSTKAGSVCIQGNFIHNAGNLQTTAKVANGNVIFNGTGNRNNPQIIQSNGIAQNGTNYIVDTNTTCVLYNNLQLSRHSNSLYRGTLTTNGTLICGGYTISDGNGESINTPNAWANVVLQPAGTIITSNNNGLVGGTFLNNGLSNTSGLSLVLSSDANYEFQGSSTGQKFTTTPDSNTVKNLTIQSLGTILQQPLFIKSNLSLVSGNLNNNNFNLTLNNNGQILRSNGSLSKSIISTTGNTYSVSYLGNTDINASANATCELNPNGGGRVQHITVNLQDNTKTVTTSSANPVIIDGNVTIQAGSLSLGNHLQLKGNWSRTVNVGKFNSNLFTVTFNQSTGNQNISIIGSADAEQFYNLTINNPNQILLNAGTSLTVLNNISLTNGILLVGNNTLRLRGNVTRQNGTINASDFSALVSFEGTQAQSFDSSSFASNISNLTINNPFGLSLSQSITVNRNLNLTSGNLSIGRNTLNIGGTVSGNGLFTGGLSSNLLVSSTSTVGTIQFNQSNIGVTNALNNFEVQGGYTTLGNSLQLYGILKISGGTLDLNNMLFVLKSTVSGTAAVDAILGTLFNANNVTVERYKNNRRAWILTTTPLSAAGAVGTTAKGTASNNGSITDNWQQFTNISGNTANGTAGGYDAGTSWGIYSWGNSNNWLVVPSLNNPNTLMSSFGGSLADNKTYFLFVRGTRAISTTSMSSSAATISANGRLQQGSLSQFFVGSPYGLVGNPYPAPINLESFRLANSNQIGTFYYWDPNIGSTGGYVTCISNGAGSFTITPANGTSSFNQNVYIQSGQGFFVQPTSGSSVNFTESQKSVSNSSNTVFGNNGNSISSFSLTLTSYDSLQQKVVNDGIALMLDNSYNDAVNIQGKDALKFINIDENVAIDYNKTLLSIYRRTIPTSTDTLNLNVSKLKQNTVYEFVADTLMLPNNLDIFIYDRYTNNLNLVTSNSNKVSFQINSDPLSYAVNRFCIVFKLKTALASTEIKLKALVNNNTKQTQLSWNIIEPSSIKWIQLQQSTNATLFSDIYSTSNPELVKQGNYNYEQTQQKVYFRIKATLQHGEIVYSNIVSSTNQFTTNDVQIIQPSTQQQIQLWYRDDEKQKITYKLINNIGETVETGSFESSNQIISIKLKQALPAGIYYLQLNNQKSYSIIIAR